MRSIKTYLTVTLLLCILLPTGLIGGTACWLMYNIIKENRIGNVGQVADARHEAMRLWLQDENDRGKALLDILIAVCRHTDDDGINACARAKLEQFAIINHAVGFTFHTGIESDLVVGSDAIPLDDLNKPFLPGQIATTSTSKVNKTPLLSLISADSVSGFSLVTTYPGQKLQDIFISSPVLGQSGETFLVDNHGLFITTPRYPSEQGVIKPITAKPMERCLNRESSEALDFDYRNVRIIHGFRFVPEIGGGCIMTHIDQEEAFAPLTRLIMGLAVAAFLLACSAWLIARMLGRGMTNPIIALADMAQALSNGDFRQQVFSTHYQEIAKLSQLFNNMAGQLGNALSRIKAPEHELEKKVAELDQRHRKYHSVIQNIGEGFWRLDRENRLLEVNPAYVRLSGYSETELMGMRITDLETQITPEEIIERSLKIMQQGTDTFETRHRRKDGSFCDVEVNTSFISEDGGHFVSFFRDITGRKRTEQELRLTHTAINKSKNAFFWLTPEGQVVYVNDYACQRLEYSREELTGLYIWDFDPDFHPEDRPQSWERTKQQDSVTFQSRHRRKDGSIFPVEIVTNYVMAPDGMEYSFVFVQDISERKRVEHELDQYRQNLEQLIKARTQELMLANEMLDEAQHIAHLGSWNWNLVNGELFWSKEAFNIYVPDHKEVTPSYDVFINAVHPDDRETIKTAIDAALEQDVPFDLEHRVVSASKGERIVHALGKVYRGDDGKAQRMVGTVQDITRIKAIESMLILAKNEADQANQAKSRFLSSMSHELRTPLNAVLGFSQLLGLDPQLSEDAKDQIYEIERAGQHLLALVDDVIDLARIESGKLELILEPVSLKLVINESLAMVAPLASK